MTETESLQIQNTDIEEMVVDCSYSDSNMDTILLSEDEEEVRSFWALISRIIVTGSLKWA